MAQDLLLDRQQPRSDQSDGGHGVGGSVASGEDDDHLPHDTSLWRDRAIVICAMLAVVGIPVMFARAATRSGGALPFHLSIGCMLIVGWTCGRAADFFLCMPPVIGYIAFGVFFGKVEGHPMHAARSYLVSLAFLLVLMRAGLEIRPQDLNAFTVALGVLPILADGLVVGVVARRLYELSVLEAATFATVVCALGDGIIIPRMMQLAKQSHGASRQIARAVLTAAPIECTCALFAFGSCSEMLSFSRSSGEEEPPGGEHRAVGGAEGVSALSQVSLVIARLIGTLLVATAIAHVFALVLGARRLLAFPASKKTLFAGSSTEELLLTIAAAMVAYGIGAVLPMPERLHPAGRIGGGRSGAEGGLVEADLAVVVALFVFARLRPRGAVRALEEGIGALWTVAALLLFTELGANLHPPAVEPTAGGVAPTALAMFAPIAAGLCARALAYAVLCASRAAARPERMPAPHDAGVLFRLHAPVWALETLFCIAGTLPRATIQGVLGGLALQNKLVSHRVGQLIQSSAALTVLLLAPLGVFMQELVCERLLARIALAEKALPPVRFARKQSTVAEIVDAAVHATLGAALRPNRLTLGDALAPDGVMPLAGGYDASAMAEPLNLRDVPLPADLGTDPPPPAFAEWSDRRAGSSRGSTVARIVGGSGGASGHACGSARQGEPLPELEEGGQSFRSLGRGEEGSPARLGRGARVGQRFRKPTCRPALLVAEDQDQERMLARAELMRVTALYGGTGPTLPHTGGILAAAQSAGWAATRGCGSSSHGSGWARPKRDAADQPPPARRSASSEF